MATLLFFVYFEEIRMFFFYKSMLLHVESTRVVWAATVAHVHLYVA